MLYNRRLYRMQLIMLAINLKTSRISGLSNNLRPCNFRFKIPNFRKANTRKAAMLSPYPYGRGLGFLSLNVLFRAFYWRKSKPSSKTTKWELPVFFYGLVSGPARYLDSLKGLREIVDIARTCFEVSFSRPKTVQFL